jgi:acylphosphatase
MSTSAVHIMVHGSVQGVGFRFFTREQATRHRIMGWVRNCPDGSVEIMAEGEDKLLDEFIEKIKSGPMFGLVTEVSLDRSEPTNTYKDFSIRF